VNERGAKGFFGKWLGKGGDSGNILEQKRLETCPLTRKTREPNQKKKQARGPNLRKGHCRVLEKTSREGRIGYIGLLACQTEKREARTGMGE